jgi:hypothetical protein
MVDVDDGLGEGLGRFLRDVVADTEHPVLVLSGELVAVSRAVPGRRERVVLAIARQPGQ